MKTRFLTFALLLALVPLGAQAQEIFNRMLDTQKTLLSDPGVDPLLRQVAQYKHDALEYMCVKLIKRDGQAQADMLNRQAVALSEFLTRYLVEVGSSWDKRNAARQEIVKTYWNAARRNPLIKSNVNLEENEKYLNDPESLLPFPLNTDWQKALKVINEQ